jgi:hypothetical protein
MVINNIFYNKKYSMLLSDLFEARKNPEMNPKMSAYDYLEPYKSNPHAYIRFTNDIKLGVRPFPDDNKTPVGIFAYPLKLSWVKYGVDGTQSFKKFPYGSSRAYINLFEYAGNILDITKYKNFDNDYKILFDKYSHLLNMPEMLNRLSTRLYQPMDFELLYRFTEMIAREIHPQQYQQTWNSILRVLGYNAFLDPNKSIIHGGEPLQALILSIKDIKPIDTFLNKDYKHAKVEKLSITTPDELINLIDFDSTINIRNVLSSLSQPLVEYFQKWLEEKNNSGDLAKWLYGNEDNHRNATDTKLLLLVWLNNHVYLRSVSRNIKIEMEHYFKGMNPSQIIKYANSMVGGIWNDSILKHNLELFKTL